MTNGLSPKGYGAGWPRAASGLQTFQALRDYNYRLLWLGSLGHSIGMWMDQIARNWLIWELTGSPVLLGLVNAAGGLPMLFFGIWGGVAADRFDRRKILLICQAVTWLVYLSLAILISSRQIQVWHIFANSILMGTAMAFNMPTRQSMIPGLVPPAMLGNAIGLNVLAMNITRVLGPTIAGVLIPILGTGGVYWLSTVIYTGVVVSTIMMRLPAFLPSLLRGTPWGDLVGGFRYIWQTRLIVTILVIGLVPILLGMPYMTLLPAFADQILGVGATGFGLLTSVAGVGGLAGALVVASVNFRREGMAMLIAAFFFGAFLVVLGAAPILVVTVPALFLIGITNSLFQAMTQTVLMRITSEEMRGRVMGIRMLDFGLSPLGSSFAGFLAELTSLPLTIMVMGSSCALLAVGAAVVAPSLRNLGREAASVEPEVVQGERLAPLVVRR